MADLAKRDFRNMTTEETDADSPIDPVLTQRYGKDINSIEEFIFAYEYLAAASLTV